MATTEAQRRIVRSAHRLRLVTIAAIAILVLAVVFAAAALTGVIPASTSVSVDTSGLTGSPAALVLLVPAALVAAALLEVAAMLRVVERGAPFGAARRLRRFALYLFLAVLAGVLLPPLVHLAVGGDRATFALTSGEALMLFVTGLLFFVARLLEEAQRVADEHGQIV